MSIRVVVLAALLASGCAAARARPALPPPQIDALAAPALPLEGRDPAVALSAPLTPDEGPAPAGGAAAEAARPQGERRAPTRRERPGPAHDAGGKDGAAAPVVEDPTALRARVVEAARARLGTRPRLDCSGYVLSALAAAGVTVDLRPARSRSESLYRAGRVVTHPRPGDLAFFHDTADRDRNGRGGDRFTHVALVEVVDGTALTLLHRGGRRIERIRMDLSRPSDPSANDPVRPRRRRDPPGTRYLSGELFAAFGELLPGEVTPMLQARRGRDTSARHPARR